MGDNEAILAGYDREIQAWNDDVELFLLVKPETRLVDGFKAWDMDKQEFVNVATDGLLIREKPQTPLLSKRLEALVSFAKECRLLDIDPHSYAELMLLAKRAGNAWIKQNNNRTPMLPVTKARLDFEMAARVLGFKTLWPSLHPSIKREALERTILSID